MRGLILELLFPVTISSVPSVPAWVQKGRLSHDFYVAIKINGVESFVLLDKYSSVVFTFFCGICLVQMFLSRCTPLPTNCIYSLCDTKRHCFTTLAHWVRGGFFCFCFSLIHWCLWCSRRSFHIHLLSWSASEY